MSRERLEELEEKYSTVTITKERDGIEYAEIDIRDLVFLIQYGFRQAERVQELNKENKRLEIKNLNYFKDIETLTVQNKRYRKVLEFYANKINHLTFIENGKSNIEHDQGEKARKALEGESE